ncbi:hypothetical protein LX32DRAFT_417760 [Colletotrichum zoysiae]|uniref:Uncharacterized protein n=1 Tax=Colletotrichum zoysiae TaxID=1216348 RepID=A0AAD9M9R0_9PEZI|nr:hypothetical protein LX32DRAFT_417760 [Colletotrichum zoysiae]
MPAKCAMRPGMARRGSAPSQRERERERGMAPKKRKKENSSHDVHVTSSRHLILRYLVDVLRVRLGPRATTTSSPPFP